MRKVWGLATLCRLLHIYINTCTLNTNPMRVEQIILLLAGLLILGSFFLPFLSYDVPGVGQTTLSGYTLTRTLLDEADVLEYEDKKLTSEMFQKLFEEAGNWKDYLAIGGMAFVFLGPIFYLLFGLGYAFRAFIGKSYKRGIWFNFLFLGLAWLAFWWTGQVLTEKVSFVKKFFDTEISLSFFEVAGLGFWLSFAAIIIAGFSLIFEKQS